MSTLMHGNAKVLEHLTKSHRKLASLLDTNTKDYEDALRHTYLIKIALQIAKLHEDGAKY